MTERDKALSRKRLGKWLGIRQFSWWLADIGAPFLTTRLLLLFIGWFSQYIPPSDQMPDRGWGFSPHRLLDIWGRWDSGWYLSIVQHGYSTAANEFGQRNTAFFPLYPHLVRFFHNLLIPTSLRTRGTILLTGVVLSNIALVSALTLLYLLIQEKWGKRNVARLTVLYLLVFPTSFVFSAFYTESLFLLLSIAAFYAAEKRRWWLAGLLGGLLTLTRATGILCVVPLAILYWKQKRQLEWDILALGWLPLCLLVLVVALYGVTGDPLELFHSHEGWYHQAGWPWQAFFSPRSPGGYMEPLDQVMTLFFVVLSFAALWTGIPYGMWALANTLLMLIVKGHAFNMTRYALVAFPAFVVLAVWSKRRPWLHYLVIIVSATLLGVLMALWSQSYRVV